ncbi:hypothetical protein AB1Y20_009414 [Prymnesium parvum]|uniref:NIPSNAP domain-containing protein n=1 Tax=Prymnesium parvum TaxID=97485 RepID=A0AB34K4I8_PRYPA
MRRTAPLLRRGGFFELRLDRVQPAELTPYLEEHASTASQRLQLFPGWLGAWKTELGGNLGEVRSLYHWRSYSERERARAAARDPAAAADVPFPSMRAKLRSADAAVFVEAEDCLAAAGLHGACAFANPEGVCEEGPVAWELRTYQLVLGYGTVPKFLDLYAEGLRDKLSVDDSGASELVTLLYSDNGPLNVVHEVWRHQSMQRAQDSRVASRKAVKWRAAVEQIAQLATSFETRYIRPLPGAPWQ